LQPLRKKIKKAALDFDFFEATIISFLCFEKFADFIDTFSKALFLLVFLVFLF